jgi:hypothetical protein
MSVDAKRVERRTNQMMPPEIQQTMIDGMRARALGDSLGQIGKHSSAASANVPVRSEPQSSESSGFWVIAVLIAIIAVIVSLFTASDSAKGDTVAAPDKPQPPAQN